MGKKRMLAVILLVLCLSLGSVGCDKPKMLYQATSVTNAVEIASLADSQIQAAKKDSLCPVDDDSVTGKTEQKPTATTTSCATKSVISQKQQVAPSKVEKRKIDLKNYTGSDKVNILSDTNAVCLNALINLREGKNYEDVARNPVVRDNITVSKNGWYSVLGGKEGLLKMVNYAALHYGDMYAFESIIEIIVYSENGGPKEYYCSMESGNLPVFQKRYNSLQREIDNVLSEFYDGTETEILLQISYWIANSVKYDIKYTTAYDAIVNRKGCCNAQVLLFRLFCERLGIHCDIIVGESSNNIAHAWNRVTLKNGDIRYYDTTFFQASHRDKYLNSTSEIHTIRFINQYEYAWYVGR